jgi:hypothetical protein
VDLFLGNRLAGVAVACDRQVEDPPAVAHPVPGDLHLAAARGCLVEADVQVLKGAVLDEVVAGYADECVSPEPAWGAGQLILDGQLQADEELLDGFALHLPPTLPPWPRPVPATAVLFLRLPGTARR